MNFLDNWVARDQYARQRNIPVHLNLGIPGLVLDPASNRVSEEGTYVYAEVGRWETVAVRRELTLRPSLVGSQP